MVLFSVALGLLPQQPLKDALAPESLPDVTSDEWAICPGPEMVLETPLTERWSAWAADNSTYNTTYNSTYEVCESECVLINDGVSCGAGVGPCCVKPIVPAAEDPSRGRNDVLKPLVDMMHETEWTGTCQSIIQEPFADGSDLNISVEAASNYSQGVASCIAGTETLDKAVAFMESAARREPALRVFGREEANRRRRYVLAAAYMQRGKHSNPNQAFETALKRLHAALAVTFTEAHNKHKKIYFLHFSKTGGTSFIHLAAKNKMKMPASPGFPGPYPKEGAWRVGDGPQWCTASWNNGNAGHPDELGCTQREHQFTKHSYHMMSVERWIDKGAENCEALTYAAVTREPSVRVLSHVNHEFLSSNKCTHAKRSTVHGKSFFDKIFNQADCKANAIAQKLDEHPRDTPESAGLSEVICGLSSNYQARNLLGDTLSSRPYSHEFDHSEVKQHEHIAKRRLLGFSLVLPIEESSRSRKRKLIHSVLGWSETEMPHDNSISNDVLHYGALGSEEKALLKVRNTVDKALHGVAKSVALIDHIFFSESGL